MGKLNTDEVQLRVVIDGSPARKELAGLEQASVGLRDRQRELQTAIKEAQAAMKGNDRLSGAYRDAEKSMASAQAELKKVSTELEGNRSRAADLRKEIGLGALSLRELRNEASRLRILRDTASSGTPVWKQFDDQLAHVNNRIKELTNEALKQEAAWEISRRGVRLMDMSMSQLEAESRRLKKALNEMHPDSAMFAETRTQLTAVEGRIASLRSGLGPFGRMWATVRGQIMGAVAVMGSFFAGGAILNGLKNLFTGAGKLSDQLVTIQKVTGQSADEMQRLNSELSKLNTRTSTKDLRGIAAGLGQAGQRVDAGNVAAVDKINVALGDEFEADAKEITNVLSVLRNNLSDMRSQNYAEDIGRIGNAVLVLGQNGLATAPVISDIATRTAGVARQFKITSGDILGTAATMQEVGLNVERGSTAYTKVLQKLASAPNDFAEVVRKAGGDVKVFRKLIDTDMQAAFIMFAEALHKVGAQNTTFGETLKDLETSGAGVSELLSKLGENSAMLREKSRLASEALKDQTAITEQFETANNSTGAIIDKLGKDIARVFSGRSLQEWIRTVILGARDLLGWLKENKDVLIVLAKVLGNAIVAWGTYRVTMLAVTAAQRAAISLQSAMTTGISLFRGEMELTTVAGKIFSKLNPFGLITTVLSTAAMLVTSFRKELDLATDSMRYLSSEQQDAAKHANALYFQILLTNQGTEARRKLIEQLKAIYPEYLSQINAETASNDQLRKSIEEVNRQMINKITIAKQEEKNQKAREAAADAFAEADKQEQETMQFMIAAAEKHGVTLYELQKAAKGAENTMQQVYQMRQAIVDKIKSQGGSGFFHEDADLNELILALGKYKGLYRIKTQIALEGEMEKQRLLKQFGLTDDFAPPAKPEEASPANVTDSLDDKQKKALEKMEDLRDEMLKIRRQMEEDGMSADEREIAQLDDKYAELRKKMLDNEQHTAADIKALDERHIQDRVDLIERQGNEMRKKDEEQQAKRLKAAQDAQDKLYNQLLADGVTQAQAEVESWDQKIQVAKEKGRDTYALELGRYSALLDLSEKHYSQDLITTMQYWDDIIGAAEAAGIDVTDLVAKRDQAIKRLGDKRRKQEEKDEQDHVVRMKAIRVQQLQDFAAVARGVSGITQSIGQYMEAQADADGVRTDREKQRIKDMALVTIAVQTAAAIANGIAQAMTQPWPANLAAAASTVAEVVGLMAQARSAMNAAGGSSSSSSASSGGAQPSLDSFPVGAEGIAVAPSGLYEIPSKKQKNPGLIDNRTGGGVLNGPSHAQQGLKVVHPGTGNIVAEVEGDELMLVMSKQFTKNNADQIPALLAASKAGKRLNFLSGAVPAINTRAATTAMRVVHAAEGALIGAHMDIPSKKQKNPGLATEGENGDNQVVVHLLQLVLQEQRRTASAAERFPTDLRAHSVFSPREDRIRQKYEAWKSQNTLSRKSA